MNSRLIICLFAIMFIYSCNAQNGRLGASGSISKSKERQVFLFEYKTESGNVEFLNKEYAISEIWLEKVWRYDNENDLGISTKGTDGKVQLCIEFIEPITNYNKEWYLGVDPNFHFRPSGKNSIISTFDNMTGDTIVIPIQQKQEFRKNKSNILGSLILLKIQ